MTRISIRAALLLPGLGLAACGGSGPAYFLARDAGHVLLVQWQAPQNAQASGDITEVQASGSPPGQTLGVTTIPVDVTISGSTVTLKPTGLDALLGGSVSGTLSNGGLTITTAPDSASGQISTGTLTSADASSYNAAVAALRHSISRGNARALARQRARARQSANTQAEQEAGDDLAAVSNDADFSGDLSALASDVSGTSSDLAAEKKDAAGGANAGGGGCYNLTANVDYDAQQNVEYDAQQNLGYDLQQNLQPDIAAVRADIGTVQNDLRSLNASGLPPPPSAGSIIGTARAAIRHAIAVANADIGAENADVNQAYAIAQGMATGSCAGQGPGPTPAPVKPIS